MEITKINVTSPDLIIKRSPQKDAAFARIAHLNSVIDEINTKLATQENIDAIDLLITDLQNAAESILLKVDKVIITDITSVDLIGVDGTASNAAPLVETEARLDAIESKINEILAALA